MVSKDGILTVRIVSTKVPHIPLLSVIFSENRQKWPS
ncbi:hypothetical protein NC653_004312 [Populus alba x Populus x berolinensis]|uniref:Uncharacterized protein n=1 Tax=Populus alba x Populus x berolinensis TaxID=444605 RepID=A0AAD6WMP0_9ROSI|nr:hypothetical protein NC653_004312 [Populus alba x Populus x berolinensis]